MRLLRPADLPLLLVHQLPAADGGTAVQCPPGPGCRVRYCIDFEGVRLALLADWRLRGPPVHLAPGPTARTPGADVRPPDRRSRPRPTAGLSIAGCT